MNTVFPAESLAALAHPAVALVIGLFFLSSWLVKKEKYFIHLSIAYLSFSIGIFSQIIKTPISVETSIFLTGLLYATSLLYFYRGLIQIGKGQPNWLVVGFLIFLFLSSRYFYTYYEFNSIKRIYALQLFITLIFLYGLWSIRKLAFQGGGAERFMFLSVLVFAMIALPRAVLTLGPDLSRYGYDTSPYWISTQIIFNVFIVVFSFSILLVHSARHVIKAEKKATLDPLTNLSNRSGFDSRANAARLQHSFFALIFIDIDRFKRINDKYGHSIGDEVLTRISAVISRNIRGADEAGRYGGEEFLLFLPNTTIDYAKTIAERLRENINQEDFHHLVRDLSCTASFGVAEFSAEVPIDTAYDYVDKLMYIAKAEGRNRVHYAPQRVSLQEAYRLKDKRSQLLTES